MVHMISMGAEDQGPGWLFLLHYEVICKRNKQENNCCHNLNKLTCIIMWKLGVLVCLTVPGVYLQQLHLQSGEQSILALLHLQLEQSPLHEHFISSLQAMETSGMVIQTGTHDPVSSLVHPKSFGEGITCCVSVLVAQIPAWNTARFTCWSRASCVGGNLSIGRLSWQKSSFLVWVMEFKGLDLLYRITVSLSSVWKCSESTFSSWNGCFAWYINASVAAS